MGQRTWATLLSLVVLITILLLNVTKSDKKVLLTSNFALYDQVKHLAPAHQKVAMLMPFGQDNHTFKPSPKNITQLMDSVAFFYVSKGMDRWVTKIDALKTMPYGMDISSDMQWIKAHEDHGHHHEEYFEHKEDQHEHDEEDVDPHYWLSIENQIRSAATIKHKLQEIFMADKEEIEHNYHNYVKTLQDLKKRYEKRLKKCQKRELFVTHDAFSYLSKQNGFHVESVVGLSPESTPNPTKMQDIIEKLSKNGVKTIFFESFSSNKIARAIASEVGISIDVLDTLATISAKDAKADRSYHDIMLRNLDKIAKALECQ